MKSKFPSKNIFQAKGQSWCKKVQAQSKIDQENHGHHKISISWPIYGISHELITVNVR